MPKIVTRRNGLTLIELVVVLTILVALGGIAAATLPNMLNRTHVATVATSLPTIDASIRQNILINSGQMGDRFDGLVTTGLSGTPAAFVNGSGAYATHSLAGNDVAALNGLGLTQLVPADDTVENATFEGHTGPAVTLANGLNVCTLAGDRTTQILSEVWNYTPVAGAQYIVLGLGAQCSLVGANEGAFFPEAPLHAVDAHSERADNSYARVLLVVELTGAGTADAEARYIGVGAPHPDGVQGVSTHLKEWYGG
ncbi:MAG: type II secretion system protein [Planctomycetota bacterium]|nr:type II secretion system protein [Planctomycetota bacterium]